MVSVPIWILITVVITITTSAFSLGVWAGRFVTKSQCEIYRKEALVMDDSKRKEIWDKIDALYERIISK